jgi:hypothetical protein
VMKISSSFERQRVVLISRTCTAQREQLHLLINYMDVQRENCGKCFCTFHTCILIYMKRNACSKIVTLELLLDTHAAAAAEARGGAVCGRAALFISRCAAAREQVRASERVFIQQRLRIKCPWCAQ